MTNSNKKANNLRDGFTGKFGFVIACIGSAIGVGNIWLFPYRVGEFGGAAFLIPYIIFVIILGTTGIVGEITLGRSMKTGPLGAFKKALSKRGWNKLGFVGIVPVIGSFSIAVGYSVVIAWITKYLVGSVTGEALYNSGTENYFANASSDFGSAPIHIIVILVVFVLMAFGVSKGIEKLNKFLMPVFFLLFVCLAISVAFLPGSEKGYEFLIRPNWDYLLEPKTWVFALGQAFFSLSLAGSGTVVYGSYLSEKEDVISGARYIAIFDTLGAIIATLVIIPAVFAFDMDQTSGPPLLFITMPAIFKSMPLGQVVSVLFFFAVLCAGVTSLVNLYETPIEALQEKFKVSRRFATGIVLGAGLVVGVFVERGDIVSTWMDVTSIFIIPLGAILAAIMVYWVCGKGYVNKNAGLGRTKPVPTWIEPLGRYGFCGIAILVYILGIAFGGIG